MTDVLLNRGEVTQKEKGPVKAEAETGMKNL